MALPTPVPGLVIRYSYLWRREYLEGREEGQKDRPCAIIAALRSDAGVTRALVLPVTHSLPSHPALAIEIPPKVKLRLGLDDERSWIMLSEWNEFVWPGPDLRRTQGGEDSSIVYGMLPPGLFNAVRDQFMSLIQARQTRPVRRT
ncbi:MAG TPA: growth inhibitor PemK [Caulobacteraceae bacterium]|nr:growth inhibitor PemK [Caulobacteraceae bacterium]